MRWFFFNWLAVLFSAMAGRSLVPLKIKVKIKKKDKVRLTKDRYLALLTRDNLTEVEKKELKSLSEATDDIVVE
jgi:hypothetical protein